MKDKKDKNAEARKKDLFGTKIMDALKTGKKEMIDQVEQAVTDSP